jgi:predicted RNA-binding Zn-ribbon protein involved in translation (DUF1610 family)
LSNLERILKRRRDVDEAELDDLRRVVLARLAVANGDWADHPPAPDRRPVVVRRVNGGTPGGAAHPVVATDPEAPPAWLLVAPLGDPVADTAASAEPAYADRPTAPADHESGRPVSIASRANMAHAASEPDTAPPMFEAGPPAQAGVDLLYEALAAEEALHEARFDAGAAPEALVILADPWSEVVDAADRNVRPQPRQGQRPGRAAAKEPRRAHPRSKTTPFASTDPVAGQPTACCPYCAVLLKQLPATDDRCPRCGQRMIVRSVGARVAILAESVLPFFEAERHNEERWTRDRDRWLELAREGGTSSDHGPDLAGELISEGDIAAARAWYMSSIDRAFQFAEKDRRWEEAARIRYEQAGVLSSIAGSSDPPSDEVVKLHRDGIAADLQAIGEAAKNAEVRGESCCEACRADDHRVVQIAEELRSPTLPHQGCPDGLCRCRWFLTARDQELLAALLRRQMGADRRAAELRDEPQNDARAAIA